MPQPTRFALSAPSVTRRKLWITLAVLAGASLAELAGGIACLAVRLGDSQAGLLLAPSGVLLMLCGLVQLRLTWIAWRAGRLATSPNQLFQFRFWRLLLIGALLAYLAALATGPAPYVGCAWIAAVSAWLTLLLLPLGAKPSAVEDWRKWTQGHSARRLAWLVYAAILILVVGELSLRAHRIALDGLSSSVDPTELEQFDALYAAIPEPLDLRVARLKPGRFRVAILGDRASGDSQSESYLTRVEQTVPGVEVVSLSAPLTGPDVRGSQLSAEVEACDPDLVLAILPVCEDLVRQSEPCGYFDWRQFELATLLVGPGCADEDRRVRTADNFESFLRELGPQLTACRTPIDDATRARWRCVFASLDQLISGCRQAQVPLALVIVPAEFQLNRPLCDTLLRRNGLSAEKFDVELPQRRLARFAEHRKLPLIDLLPHLRLCRESIYRRNTTVLNDEGNSAAASAIGGWLQSRYAGQLAAQ